MKDPVLTPDLEAVIAKVMKQNKPHLVKIEELIQDLYDGNLEFKVDVRSGRAEKISVVSVKTWVREKEVDIKREV